MELDNIYCGDAQRLIDDLDKRPNLIIMSPPDIAETQYDLIQYKAFLNNIYVKCAEKLHPNGVLVSITTDRKIDGKIYTKHIDIIQILNPYLNLFNYKIWAKSLKGNLYILNYAHVLAFRQTKKITNHQIAEYFPDVWVISRDPIKGYKNKDSFPTKLVEIIIKNFTNEGDIVLDPFIGTGKTACVCKLLNRRYIGFELEKNICKLAQSRINDIKGLNRVNN